MPYIVVLLHGDGRGCEQIQTSGLQGRGVKVPADSIGHQEATDVAPWTTSRIKLMELRTIKGLVKLVQASSLSEIEFNNGASSIRIVSAPTRTTNGVGQQTTSSRPAIESKAESAEVSTSGHVVRSPIVGISRISAHPDQPPFAVVGKAVRAGDTLGIVATLNTSRLVSAELPGVVIEVLVVDGQPVELDQPLFVIDAKTGAAVDVS